MLLVVVHLLFAVRFLNNWGDCNFAGDLYSALLSSLVPSAMWPFGNEDCSRSDQLGTGNGVDFWCKTGIDGFPLLIG